MRFTNGTPILFAHMLKNISFILILSLGFTDSIAFADGTEDTIPTSDTVLIALDDPVLVALDQMYREPLAALSPADTSKECLNIHDFPPDSIPIYEDDYYKQRLSELDAKTPFKLTYNERVRAFIHLYVVKRREQAEKLLALQHQYFPMIEEKLDEYDMPYELKYLAVIESALNPRARSRAGAMGLWQFMYTTGKLYGLHQNSYMDERLDPIKSTDAALRYLQYLHSMYQDWDLALAAYNCGPGNVNRALRRAGSKTRSYWDIYRYLPRETRGYVPAFIAANYFMQNAQAHNLYPDTLYTHFFELDTVHVQQAMSFEYLSSVLNIDEEYLAQINPAYKRNYIPAYSNKSSIVYLPYESASIFVMNENRIYADLTKKEEKEVKEFKEERIIYTVRSGDYLGRIAQNYHVSVSNLRSWNNLSSSRLRVGQKLVIYQHPGRAPVPRSVQPKTTSDGKYIYYSIRTGDTLWDIAKAKGVSVNQIKAWNSHLNYKRLKPGTRIIVGTAG